MASQAKDACVCGRWHASSAKDLLLGVQCTNSESGQVDFFKVLESVQVKPWVCEGLFRINCGAVGKQPVTSQAIGHACEFVLLLSPTVFKESTSRKA